MSQRWDKHNMCLEHINHKIEIVVIIINMLLLYYMMLLIPEPSISFFVSCDCDECHTSVTHHITSHPFSKSRLKKSENKNWNKAKEKTETKNNREIK